MQDTMKLFDLTPLLFPLHSFNMSKTISEHPKTTDTILFQLETTDIDDNLISPYKMDRIVIYFLAKDIVNGNNTEYDRIVENKSYVTYFNHADTIKVFGNDIEPAWFTSDPDNSVLSQVETGKFELLWRPEFAREGDYIICWTWTPNIGDNPLSAYVTFYLDGDTQQTTNPIHTTNPDKYPTLLERYTPDFLKLKLCDDDLTPEIMHRLNLSIADGFTLLENLYNQLPDLLDANVIHEDLILYLANTLGVSLRSNDITLWRRQIKQAVPLFKKKGTFNGLKEALSQAGIQLNKLTRLWQVVSQSTWQEAFVFSGNNSWVLSKMALSPIDSNYEVYLRLAGESDYAPLIIDNVVFTNTYTETTMTWVGDDLMDGDIVRIIYKFAEPSDQSLEDYIRSLPLADQRDEAVVTYPPKNWNVRLIAEDDALFDTIIPSRHPFADFVIYGKIRTEFPYSENAYNMDEYNASIRSSTDPCHLGKDFVDNCSSCISSKFNVDIEIENLTDSRIDEAEDIIREYVPFHAQIQSINYSGVLSDYVLPPVETIECFVKYTGREDIIFTQKDLTRSTTKDIKRDMLANTTVEDSSTGTGYNDNIILYSPNVNFTNLGIINSRNYLEILSGPNIGEYTVENSSKYFVNVNQSSPDSLIEPVDSAAFTYRISNMLYSGTATSVTQDDWVIFSDGVIYIAEPGWKVSVTSPLLYAGDYDVVEVYPNGTVQISGWTGIVDVEDIEYQFKNNLDVVMSDISTTGSVSISRRGLVAVSSDIKSDFGLSQGDYALIDGDQYLVNEFASSYFYIKDYVAGDMGATSITIYRRLLSSDVGYLKYNGMTLVTSVNYESSLGIMNGANGGGMLLEDSSAKENYLILIGLSYYKINEINSTIISISGPKLEWELTGTSVNFSIMHVANKNVEVKGEDIYLIDRRSNETVKHTILSGLGMEAMMASVNTNNQGQTFSPVYQSEKITCTIIPVEPNEQ